MHLTQALINVVSNVLHADTIDTIQLINALVELRRHLESPHSSFMHVHPATETNIVEVIERILLCWVCARASQTDAQNYRFEKIVETKDKRFDKYAGIPEQAICETVQCISYLATASAGVAAVSQSSIATSLALLIAFTDNLNIITYTLRALTKLCTKHSVKRAKADGRWESKTGMHAVLHALTCAQTALRLRNRFDTISNCLFLLVSELAASLHYKSSELSSHNRSFESPTPFASKSGSTPTTVNLMKRTIKSLLNFFNTLIEAHTGLEDRLRIRKEMLDTALYLSIKLLEELEHGSDLSYEIKRFRRSYIDDIESYEPFSSKP
ncbi:hypothetical protein LPJ68_004125 [Coemansia sp. RSA 1086]|nr:hypothetical protein LPJ68_004125 [Coemansia sp. RSA 1086]